MPQSVLDPGIGGGLARALSEHRPASAPPDEDSTGGGWGAAMPEAPPASSSPFGSALAERFAQGDGPAAAAAPPALTHGGGAPGSFQPGLGGFAPASPAGGWRSWRAAGGRTRRRARWR
jgi:hypothetical protein